MTAHRLHGGVVGIRRSHFFSRLIQSMYFENNRTLPLTSEWSAEFVFRYQVSMSGDGWGLVLHGPDGKTIDKFKDFIAFCGQGGPEQDTDEDLMRILSLSRCNRYLTIRTIDGNWVADLETCELQEKSASAGSSSVRSLGCFSLIIFLGIVLISKLVWAILHVA